MVIYFVFLSDKKGMCTCIKIKTVLEKDLLYIFTGWYI